MLVKPTDIMNAVAKGAMHLTKNQIQSRRNLIWRTKIGDLIAFGGGRAYDTLKHAKEFSIHRSMPTAEQLGYEFPIASGLGIFMGYVDVHAETTNYGEKFTDYQTWACVLTCGDMPRVIWIRERNVAMRLL